MEACGSARTQGFPSPESICSNDDFGRAWCDTRHFAIGALIGVSDTQVLTVAQMQAAEQALIDGGTSVDELMQIAGNGAAEWVWRLAAGRSVTVLCGPGNNGGDGYVIAENLRARGLAVQVVAPISPKTDAAKNARARFGGKVLSSGKSCIK